MSQGCDKEAACVTSPLHLQWERRRAKAAFFGRLGGVSTGPYSSLNLSSAVGDQPRHVAENWSRVRGTLSRQGELALLQQVHGATVWPITRNSAREKLRGDAMVANEAGVALGILTADCVPVLMLDADAGVIGALHSGWRGTLANIAQAGVDAMVNLGARPARIEVAIGPAIGKCCYEVDARLGAQVVAVAPPDARAISAGRPGKAMLDLPAVVSAQLVAAGVAPEAITTAGRCTRCASMLYFSRRAAGGGITGLQLSFIELVEQ